MIDLALAHIDWAIDDNDVRKACDAFLIEVFGAEVAFEMLVTPETEAFRFDREETLLVIGDVMLIPIAPAGEGLKAGSPIGEMLRKNARAGKWIGLALRTPDLAAAAEAFQARGFRPRYDPGMENHYFMISPRELLGFRLEVMQGDLPNDPRVQPDWAPAPWRDDHPLGLLGLQSIGVSCAGLEEARALFVDRLGGMALARRSLAAEAAECAAFQLGDAVFEAMQPLVVDSPLAGHLREVQGIYSLTFQVRDAAAAAGYLRGKGLTLQGDQQSRFWIAPEEAFGRRFVFTDAALEGRPPLGSALGAMAAKGRGAQIP